MELFSLYATIGLQATDFETGVTRSKAEMQDLAVSVQKDSDAMQKNLLKFSAVGAAALLAVGTTAFASAASVDNAFGIIRRSSGATGDDLESLKSSFRVVFADVPESAETVADVLSKINTATGLTGKGLEELTGLTLKYARANKEDAAASADVLGRLMNALEVDTSDLAVVMDQLTAASQMSGIGVNNLAEYIISAGPSFEEMGFSVERSIALFSSFYKAGAEPRELLSSLNILLNKMAKEGLTDAEGAFNDLLQSIKDAPDILSATTIASEMFGSRVGAKVADDIRAGRFEIDEWVQALQNVEGTLVSTADETVQFSDKLSIFKNQATLALEPLGTKIIDQFSKGLEAGGKAVEFVGRNLDTLTTIVGVATVTVGGFTAAWTIGNTIQKATSAIKLAQAAVAASTIATGANTTVLGANAAAQVLNTAAKAAGYKVDANGQIVTAAGIALTKAQTAELLASTGVITAKQLAVGVLSGQIGIATAAQKLWNLAMAANPIGMAIAGVALLAGGLIALSKATNRETEEQKALREQTEETISANERLIESIEESAKAYDDRVSAIDSNAEANRRMANQIFETSRAEDMSASEKRILQMRIDELNNSLGETVIRYDAEKNALIGSTGKIIENAEAIDLLRNN
ncbi:MAG: phage tail tape measure protein [Oscillospiraceae bacterium]|nr:phage tail tape measure protein [Oscillospiraceae bacterium]